MRVSVGKRPAHPGETLREELEEIGLSADALARVLHVPMNRVTTILNGQRGLIGEELVNGTWLLCSKDKSRAIVERHEALCEQAAEIERLRAKVEYLRRKR